MSRVPHLAQDSIQIDAVQQIGPKQFGKRRHRSAHNDIRHSTQLVDIFYHILSGGSTRHEVDPGVCTWDPILGEGEIARVSDGTIRKSDRLSIVTIALSLAIRPQFAIESLRRSNQQEVGHFWGQNVDRKGLTDISEIFTRSGRPIGLSYAKEIVSISSAV